MVTVHSDTGQELVTLDLEQGRTLGEMGEIRSTKAFLLCKWVVYSMEFHLHTCITSMYVVYTVISTIISTKHGFSCRVSKISHG